MFISLPVIILGYSVFSFSFLGTTCFPLLPGGTSFGGKLQFYLQVPGGQSHLLDFAEHLWFLCPPEFSFFPWLFLLFLCILTLCAPGWQRHRSHGTGYPPPDWGPLVPIEPMAPLGSGVALLLFLLQFLASQPCLGKGHRVFSSYRYCPKTAAIHWLLRQLFLVESLHLCSGFS